MSTTFQMSNQTTNLHKREEVGNLFLKLGMLGEEQGTDCHRTNKIYPFHAYMDLRAHLNKTKSYHIKRLVLISGHIRSSTMTSIGQIRS